jgi:hypothetical protein
MIDIDDIKKRHLDPERNRGRTYYEGHIEVDLAALVAEVGILRQEARIRNNINDGLAAEVGKLRAENAELELGVETMRTRMNNAYAQRNRIQNEERAAVVAWLREPGEYVDPACARLADIIERGEHRREEKP